MKVYQFVHTLNYGDAISGEALSIKKIFQAKGIPSEIYALHAHDRVKDEMKHWTQFKMDFAQDRALGESSISILHYSLGSPLNDLFKELKDTKRCLIYHNLTPPRWFASYNSRVHRDIVQGVQELPQLLAHFDLLVADSDFNRMELAELGFSGASVLPLLLDGEKWGDVVPNRGVSEILRGNGSVNFLHVGRIAPNKCLEDIIKVFYFYHYKINLKSRLWLIGSDVDTEIYSFELRRLVRTLSLQDFVNFVGVVADCELRAFYENSDAYICMSEHEGFCVPLLEAMNFGLPVIAFASSAVPETMGDAGILIEQKEHGLIAEIMHLLVTDSELRDRSIQRGKERARAFGREEFSKKLFATLGLCDA